MISFVSVYDTVIFTKLLSEIYDKDKSSGSQGKTTTRTVCNRLIIIRPVPIGDDKIAESRASLKFVLPLQMSEKYLTRKNVPTP